MTDCKDCKSNDVCKIEEKPCDGKGNCFFFSETEESRIRNSMEYKQGRADMLDSIIQAEKNKYYCVEDLCDESKNCSDCMVKYLEQLKEKK